MVELIKLTNEQQRELDQMQERINILKQELDAIYDEYSFQADLGPDEARASEKWYNHHPKVRELNRLYRHRKLLQGYSLTDSFTYIGWNKVPLLVFVDACLEGEFTDNNTEARYATIDKVSSIRVEPSDILERLYRNDFQYVVYRNIY